MRAEFAAALLVAMRSAGLYDATLARKLGLSIRTVQRWLLAQSSPPATRHTKLLTVLGDVPGPVYSRLTASLGYESPAPPAPAPPPPPDTAAIRRAIDDAVRTAAEDLDVGAKRFRIAVDTVLAALEAHGMATKQAREMVASPRDKRS